MAQLRFRLAHHPKGTVVCNDWAKMAVWVTYTPDQDSATLVGVQVPELDDISCEPAATCPAEGVVLIGPEPLRLTCLLGQPVQLTFAVESGDTVTVETVLPDRLQETSAPPELDSLLTTMMEDDAIIMVPFEEEDLFHNLNDAETPRTLPSQFASEAADALAALKTDDDPDSFVLLNGAKFK